MITKNRLNIIKNKALALKKINNATNPEKISKYLDIEILYRPYKKQLGAFTIINKIPFIFINENLSYEEKQIIIAHEMGHFLLHKKYLKDLLILRDYSLFSKREKEMEIEANIFSAYLLIDKKQLIELQNQYKTNKEIANILNVNVNLVELISNTDYN